MVLKKKKEKEICLTGRQCQAEKNKEIKMDQGEDRRAEAKQCLFGKKQNRE